MKTGGSANLEINSTLDMVSVRHHPGKDIGSAVDWIYKFREELGWRGKFLSPPSIEDI